MASAITHFIVGASILLPAAESRSLNAVLPGWSIPFAGGLLAVAPDIDTYAARAFDISRGSIWSHRGVIHSPVFLILLCAVVAALPTLGRGGKWQAWLLLTLIWAVAAITHPLLDMLTDGGSGVMFLYPFNHDRYFFPWRPIRVSPLSVTRFFSRAGSILRSEAPFDAAAILAGVLGWIARRRSA